MGDIHQTADVGLLENLKFFWSQSTRRIEFLGRCGERTAVPDVISVLTRCSSMVVLDGNPRWRGILLALPLEGCLVARGTLVYDTIIDNRRGVRKVAIVDGSLKIRLAGRGERGGPCQGPAELDWAVKSAGVEFECTVEGRREVIGTRWNGFLARASLGSCYGVDEAVVSGGRGTFLGGIFGGRAWKYAGDEARHGVCGEQAKAGCLLCCLYAK